MADPDKDYTPISIRQDHPIVTQAWTPPYKPAVHPLQKSWSNVIAEANAVATTESSKHGRGGRNPLGADFFYHPPSVSPRSNRPGLPGGAAWGGGGGNHNNNNVSRAATTVGQSTVGGGGGSGFNAFQFAAAAKGDAQQQQQLSSWGGGGGMMMLPSGLRSNNRGGGAAAGDSEEDEYDDRVDLMRSNIGRAPVGSHHKPRLTKQQKEQLREEYKKRHEANLQAGIQSGGEVDEGCVGAMGDDDEVRDLRLRFTPNAAAEDGTIDTAFASAVAHRRRGGAAVRTPPPHASGTTPGRGGFVAPGLRTPVFDPHSQMPAPVARYQRRQQHNHYLLRMLGGGGASPIPNAGDGHHQHHHQQQQHLFPPHEIPVNEEDTKRKNRFDDPSQWLFGRDESIKDVLEKHFLREEREQARQQHQQQTPQNVSTVKLAAATPTPRTAASRR